MRDVYVIGVGMTPFGRHLERSIRNLTGEALQGVLTDAGLDAAEIQAVWFANSTWGYFSGQHCVRGEVALRETGVQGAPVINVENACGGGATALHSGWLGVASGLYDCVLAIGVEKLYDQDKRRSFQSLAGGTDVEAVEDLVAAWRASVCPAGSSAASADLTGASHSFMMDIYAWMARWHMKRYGTTQRQLAVIASKNHFHGSLNPYAQYRQPMSVEEVLAGRPLGWPLTVPMCAPMGDGAAAAVLCSGDYLERVRSERSVKVLASAMGSNTSRAYADEANDVARRVSRQAYERAGIGPEDVDVAEVHDAAAFGELRITEALGFCAPGEGGPFAESGATMLGGRVPVNPSGGLESRGHPLGASGLAQIYEITTQLRGEAGPRQVQGARVGLAENGGGLIHFEEASMHIHILQRS